MSFEDCILPLFSLNSTLLFKECPWPQEKKSSPCESEWDFCDCSRFLKISLDPF